MQRFNISPLVRFTLFGLLISLVLPLPFLLLHQGHPESIPLTLLGSGLGGVVLAGLMSQRVRVDEVGVQVEYAPWVPRFLVKGWQLPWEAIARIESRVTGQGGRVHYLVNHQGEGYLLPMRIAGFNQFLNIVAQKTNLDTRRVMPLAQPWMYLTLLGCVVMLLLVDLWIIAVAVEI